MTWIMTIFPAALLLLGFPIYVTLLATCAIVILAFYPIPATALPQIMFGSLDSSALLAVPFFILAGEIMGTGGISRRLVNWSKALFGGTKASLPITTIATCVVFGAISGSSAATVASVGKITFQPMLDAGYDRRFAAGLLTASGLIDNMIPPSIAMILFAAVAEVSIVKIFSAGIIPGLLFALAFAAYVWIRGHRSAVDTPEPFSTKRLMNETANAVWALGLPALILGGIYSGVITATEAGGISCIYAVVVSVIIYREIKWADLRGLAERAAYITSQVMIVLAAAGVYSWLLTTSGAGPAITSIFKNWALHPWILLLMVNVVLLLVGIFLDPPPAILLLTPILMPIIKDAGIDPIHFGIIMTANLSIGCFTPP
ncbi:MAG: TRAP transporter large permease, partial [Afipia sp.]|nr:TRAP transporter large permease [Afipia sp.]